MKPMPDSDFLRDGYLGPLRVLTADECQSIGQYLRQDGVPAPSGWNKARAVHERFLYDLATRPAILDRVAGLLGDDVVLWGVSEVRRRPGQVHPWHSDIESCAPEGGFVSVWIGIENTSRDSSLQIISRSHRLRTVQEARAAVGLKREDATPEALVRLAHQTEAEAKLVVPDMGNGEAIFFDGRLWHGTDNRNRAGDRLALLLQYAAANRPVRIPDLRQLDWPFRFVAEPLPPVILVRGTDGGGGNRVVPPPPPSGGTPMVETTIHTFALPLGQDEPTKPWQPFPAFRGPTRCLTDMSCHASVLVGGHVPHPPHHHIEEEILIVLHGEVELTIPSGPSDPTPRLERLGPGSFVYYPAWQWHTIRNPGTAPVGYLMFKWKAPLRAGSNGQLATQVIRMEEQSAPEGASPVWQRRLMDGPTGCLGKLHSHVTVVAPGAGYEPHRDAYDVAIVPLTGTVETLGHAVSPMSVIYYGAGELHGMRNRGADPARYLVFEFHAPGVDPLRGFPLHLRVTSALVRGGKRLARPVWRRVKRYLPKRG